MKTKVIDFIELYNSILYNTNDLTIMYDKKSTNRSFEVYITGHYLELYRPISVHTLGLINNFNINFKVLADKKVCDDFAKDLKYLIEALEFKESMGFDKVSHISSAFMYILDNIEIFASYLDSEIISNE
jgi:hypothetical protein